MENKLPNTIPAATVDDAIKRNVRPQPSDSKISPEAGMPRTKDATTNLFKIYQFVGQIFPQKFRYLYILYSFVLNTLTTGYFPIAFAISYWHAVRFGIPISDFGILLNSIQVFFNLLSCETKIWIFTLKRHTWRPAFDVMERLDRRCWTSSEELDELRKCVHTSNRFVVYYLIFYWTYATTTFLGAFFTGRPMYNIYIPYLDWRHSHNKFVAASIIEFLLIDVACAQQVFNDMFSLLHVYILRTHMRILLLRFARLGDDSLSLDENLDALKQCIRDHKNYLELYNILAPNISATVFLQFVVTALILSTTLVNIMLIATDFYSRVGSFCYLFAIIAEILPLCYNAQCLMNESDRLAEVIFHSNWVDQDVRYRKLLIFLIQRTQCTTPLLAGKLFPINLTCCLSIIKFSFSLYTFIKTMGIEEKFGLKK